MNQTIPFRWKQLLGPIPFFAKRVVSTAALTISAASLVHGESAEPRSTITQPTIEVSPLAPVEVMEKEPGHIFADFGQVSFGGLEFTIANPEPGRKLTFFLGEALSAPQTVHRNPGGSVRFHTSEVLMEAKKTVYRVPLSSADKRLMPEQVGAVMPFRYVEITGVPEGFGKENLRQLAAHCSFDDNAAHFESSDPELNAVWKLCKHTIKATSFGGIFIDGDRERKPYEADVYINQLGWYACTSDTMLPRYSWEYLIKHPTWPTEWILFSVLLAWNDYQYTGDLSPLKAFYQDLQAKTLIDLERPDGLISTVTPPVPKAVEQAIHIQGIRDIVDWPIVERDRYEMKPINTVVNAFHATALHKMAEIARILKYPEDAARFNAAAERATNSLNTILSDPSTGLYVDGEGSRHSSIHANFFPLTFGLVPKERQQKIAAFLAERGMACSVYGAQFLLEALFDYGHADRALSLITADGNRSWKYMVGQGATLTWEAWDEKIKPNQDWNHAWGAAPANLIPRKLMGITPLEPGFEKVLIQPRSGSLKWAEMRIPTVKGSIFVRFDNGPDYRLEIEIPAGTTAKVGLPVTLPDGPTSLLLDGKQHKGMVMANTAFLDGLSPGRHIITAQGETNSR